MSVPASTGSTSGVRSILLPTRSRTIRFSNTEIRHLIIGTALVVGAGISFLMSRYPSSVLGLAIATIIFAMGFILHELAHKYVAQRYGLWAEFRVNTMGVIITALSIVARFGIIAPGAVVISGFADKDRVGLTAVAGPIVNLTITFVVLAGLNAIPSSSFLYAPIVGGAAINAFLALFNLIPVAILDGKKVYAWNKKYWAAMFAIALVLTVYTYIIL